MVPVDFGGALASFLLTRQFALLKHPGGQVGPCHMDEACRGGSRAKSSIASSPESGGGVMCRLSVCCFFFVYILRSLRLGRKMFYLIPTLRLNSLLDRPRLIIKLK